MMSEHKEEQRLGAEGLGQGHAAPCWRSDSEGSIVSWRAGKLISTCYLGFFIYGQKGIYCPLTHAAVYLR